jgi:hypothetical protein
LEVGLRVTIGRTVTVAGIAALVVSGTVLGLLVRFGIWKYMLFGRIDLRLIVWPSSVMLPLDWCTTAHGIFMTLFSVVVNCFLYVGIALMLRICACGVRRWA